MNTTPKFPVLPLHPYDRGYWERYDGKPRPKYGMAARQGWDDCDAELRAEKKYGAVAQSVEQPE